MSDLDEMEIDYTRFHNGMCNLKELKVMREKYFFRNCSTQWIMKTFSIN